MTPDPWSLDPWTLAAIVAMAAATILTRIGGLILLRFATLTPKARAVLDATPAAVLAAVVTPTALSTGLAETLACVVTGLAATRLPMLPAVTAGVVSVVVLRLIGL